LLDPQQLRSGDRARVHFTFRDYPEYDSNCIRYFRRYYTYRNDECYSTYYYYYYFFFHDFNRIVLLFVAISKTMLKLGKLIFILCANFADIFVWAPRSSLLTSQSRARGSSLSFILHRNCQYVYRLLQGGRHMITDFIFQQLASSYFFINMC
jgi:hypothetical protein